MPNVDCTSEIMLLQLLLSVRDVDDELVALSLNALAALVPILGGDIVIGEGRRQLFSRGKPKVCHVWRINKHCLAP